jgi:transposase InsO family protein
MLTRLHANATTTPKVRAEIQASLEPVAVLAVRYGVSETTIRRWRSRTSPEDRSHKRHNLGQATTPLEEEIIAGLRRLARLSLDDITEVMNRCINPRLSRGSVWTALRRAGLSGRLRAAGVEPGTERPAPFEATPFGYVHVDLRYLARLDGRGEYVFVAIERMTRFAWIEIMPDRSAARVAAAMTRFLTAFGHPVHTVLTDNGSEFTDRFGGDVRVRQAKPSGRHAFDRLCAAHGIEHRLTRPYTPKTNGMVERFNRRIGEAISGAMQFRKDPHRRGTFQSHAERAAFLTDFVDAYNRTRLRCIGYKTPSELLNNQIGDNTWAGASRARPGSRGRILGSQTRGGPLANGLAPSGNGPADLPLEGPLIGPWASVSPLRRYPADRILYAHPPYNSTSPSFRGSGAAGLRRIRMSPFSSTTGAS